MANVFSPYEVLSGPGVFNVTRGLTSPIILPTKSLRKELYIRATQIEISDRIPNVFNGNAYGVSFDNTKLRVGTNTEAYVTVELPMGLYLEASMLNAAINSAINNLGWWTNPADPGFTIVGNSVTNKFIITIDSSKLNPLFGAQFKIDFQYTSTLSSFYQLIGFNSTSELIADGTYESPVTPIMETQGTACIVELDLVQSRKFGLAERRVLAQVSFAGKESTSNSIWPQGGQLSPSLIYTGPRQITQYTIQVRTRAGALMVFMEGILSADIVFE